MATEKLDQKTNQKTNQPSKKMINISLSVLIIMLGFYYRADRVVFYFCLITGLFNIIGYFMPASQGLIYYCGAALTDLLIISLISKNIKISELNICLQKICCLSILVNFSGWLIYMLYFSPFIYNVVSSSLTIYAIIIIMNNKGMINHVRTSQLGIRNRGVFDSHHPSSANRQSHEAEKAN